MENLDNLLYYLQEYTYQGSLADNVDFDSSLRCMEEVADDLFNTIIDTPYYKKPDIPYTNTTLLRLLSAIFLASRKKNRINYKAIIRIASILLKMDVRIGAHLKLQEIITNCIHRYPLRNFTISWIDIQPGKEVLFGVFLNKFLNTTFHEEDTTSTTPYFENSGLLVFPPYGRPTLSLLNLDQFRNDSKFMPSIQLTSPGVVDLTVLRRDYEKWHDFRSLYPICRTILKSQSAFAGTVKRNLKEYQPGQPILVRIIYKRDSLVVARTVDPSYATLEGKVSMRILNSNLRPNTTALLQELAVGDYLQVNLSRSEEFTFDIDRQFETFYREFAAECYNKTYRAIYSHDFRDGEMWITEEGVSVAVHRQAKANLSEEALYEYNKAVKNDYTILLTFYSDRPKTDGDVFYTYALVGDGNGNVITDDTLTQSDAYSFIIRQYLDYTHELSEEIALGQGGSEYKELTDPDITYAFLSLLISMVNLEIGSSTQRLQNITMAEFLAHMLRRTGDVEYLRFKRRYLNALVSFSANEEVPVIEIPESIASLPECIQAREILMTLRSYKKREVLTTTVAKQNKEAETPVIVTRLVNSSNSLIDIIDTLELNNIKQAITKTLGVEDEFKSILDNRTFYGMESVNLEFKSTVVYPPKNMLGYAGGIAQPDLQKWNIIKAVCGFLNSRSGGELLIGVNDAGYAVRLDDDIRMLNTLKIISSPDFDHYRTYIQAMMDCAFSTEGDSRTFNPDISYSSIRVSVETNAEKLSIIRIKISPYPTSIVTINPTDRPSDIKNSYVRDNGRTIEITNTLRAQVEAYKKNV